MNKTRTLFLILLAISIAQTAFAQLGTSPYTVLGLGESIDIGNARNIGMGGVGVSNGSFLYTNVSNPALLIHNQYAVFEASYLGEYKTLSFNGQTQEDAGGNLLNLNFAFPIVRGKYTMAIGLRPSTLVNYNFKLDSLIEGTPTFIETTYKGSGGLSQAYWAHGVKIAKGISLGAELIYNFGSVTDEAQTQLFDPNAIPVDGIDVISRTTFSDITFKPGIVISEKIDSATYVNFGFTYEKSVTFDVDYSREVERRTRGNGTIDLDTISSTTEQLTMPDIFNFGVSIEKTFKYSLGVDFSWQKWSSYQYSLETSNLSDAWRLSVGGEWTPDASSVSSYFKRVTYRAGFRYYNTPWTVNDTQITDVGINFGLSLPVSRGLSNINLAFTVGERGESTNTTLKERYYRVAVGININDPQWFRRRRFN